MNVDKDYEFKKPPAVHEVKRSSVITALIVIALAISIPIMLIPEEEPEDEFYEPQEVSETEQEVTAQPEPAKVELDSFGEYQAKQQKTLALLEKLKNFVVNYTVFGFIFSNVDKEKVSGGFKDLKEKSQQIHTRHKKPAEEKQPERN